MTPDPQRLERVLAALDPADAEWLLAQVAPAKSRLDVRDEAIRAAAATLSGSPSRRAADLERALRRYLAAGWSADKRAGGPAADAQPLRRHLFAIVALNNERCLAWRQLLRVLEGERTPLPTLS